MVKSGMYVLFNVKKSLKINTYTFKILQILKIYIYRIFLHSKRLGEPIFYTPFYYNVEKTNFFVGIEVKIIHSGHIKVEIYADIVNQEYSLML